MPKDVKPPDVEWFNSDSSLAYSEGWGIFNDCQVQRIDSPDDEDVEMLDSDDSAINLICEKALAGSVTHIKALILHMRGLADYVEKVNSEDGRGEDW